MFSNRKERDAHAEDVYNKTMPIYIQTNNTYNLGIDYSALRYHCLQYAHAHALKEYGDGNEVFNDTGKIALILVSAIVSIVITAFSDVSLGYFFLIASFEVIAAGAGIATIGVINVNKTRMNITNNFINSINNAKHILKSANDVKNKQVTDLLIYQPYAMFANGEIYNKDRAGAVGYQAGLEAVNPMRAINGEYKENELAKQITNTAHTKLAGNDEYNPLSLPFPQKKFELYSAQSTQIQAVNIKQEMEQIQRGFSILAENYFCFDDRKAFKKYFDENIHRRVNPKIKELNSFLFLEQNRYYNKGERLPLFMKIKEVDTQALESTREVAFDKNLAFINTLGYGEFAKDLLECELYEFMQQIADEPESATGKVTWNFPKMNAFFKKMKPEIWVKQFRIIGYGWEQRGVYENHLDKRRYWQHDYETGTYIKEFRDEQEWQNALNALKVKMTHRVISEFDTHFALLFLLSCSGEVAVNTYALKEEAQGHIENNKPLQNGRVPIFKDDNLKYYAIMLCRKKANVALESAELKDLKAAMLDLYNPPKISLWDYYKVELIAAISEGNDVPSYAEQMARKYNAHNDDFMLYAINDKMFEAYSGVIENMPKQWRDTNTLFNSYLAYREKS